jgi:hypothetical protein
MSIFSGFRVLIGVSRLEMKAPKISQIGSQTRARAA